MSHLSRQNAFFYPVSGDDQERQIALEKLKEYNVSADIIIDHNRPTTFKTRYMAANQKLFRVSRLMDTNINADLEDQLIEKIELLAPKLDNIIVGDFVYGVITDRILSKLVEVSKRFKIKIFGDLQCSSQVGNVSKFVDFDMIFPTEKKLELQSKIKMTDWNLLPRKFLKMPIAQILLSNWGQMASLLIQK